jgi:peptide-methionine (S)-S-oxide reductase
MGKSESKQIKTNQNKITLTPEMLANLEKATFGGGCFWCVEGVFQRLQGVKAVESGYAGGKVENPTYEDICSGKTGHAEVVQVTYDPKETNYREILVVFFLTHDPTTLNQQGNDHGTQYRSVIFYHNDEQKKIAEEVIKKINDEKHYKDPIVTEVSPLKNYYKAENYHQNYYNTNPNQGYCKFVVKSKIDKFMKLFEDKSQQSI